MAKKNFSISTVATAPDPATTGTSLVVATGDGSLFATGEVAVIFPDGEQPDSANAEIVLITDVTTDTLTITREQESTSARTIVVGDIILQQISAGDWNGLITSIAGKVAKSTYDAQTILHATTDDTPVALTVGEQTVVGRATGGNISALAIDSDISSVSANHDTLPSAKATKAYVDNFFGSNSFQVDQSGGTSDTHGVLSGTINGSNTTFTVSLTTYVSGSLLVFLNGQLQTQGTGQDWVENTPASGTFDFNTAPVSGDEIVVYYLGTTSTSGNADTLDSQHAPSGTIVGTTDSQTLTNKTLDGDSNTLVDLQNFKFNLQSNTTNSAPSNLKIQYGWGYIDGAAATNITKSVTFPVAFDSAPIVLVTDAGDATSAPSAIGDLITSGTAIKSSEDVTTTTFTVRMWLRDAGNLSATVYYGFAWIAIGVKA